MNTLNNQHSESLRDVDLMISYLRDEVSLKEVEKIEDLMEQDDLYRLSMEQLSQTLVESSPAKTSQYVIQLEQSLPNLLAAQRDNFIAQLEGEGGNADTDSSWVDNLKNGWQKYLLIVAIPLIVFFAVLPFSKDATPHKNAEENLMPNGDVYLANVLLGNCRDYNDGIGRGKELSIFTAIVDEYSANANYENASKQLDIISKDPALPQDCKALVDFYLANSYMALNDYNIATRMFMQVLMNKATTPEVMNASHWYLANIYLIQKDYQAAKKQFSMLLDNQDEKHLQKLVEKKYIEDAHTYMEFLESK